MSKLLIDDYPIQVLPKLAVTVGLNEAIFIQQLHYWISGKSAKVREDKKWIYNTYESWAEQFPFWSVSTIRRTITSCENKELIFVGNYNRMGADKTKWYSVNYETVNRLSSPCVQNEQRDCSKWTDQTVQNEQTYTIDYPETTTETKNTMSSKLDDDDSSKKSTSTIPYKIIIDYLNEQTGKNYRNVETNKKLIRTRWNEGYRVEDFKKVIDTKVEQWRNNKEMQSYLRPTTLFNSKFDGYLNEKATPIKREKEDVFEKMKEEGLIC